jgi:superoxide reductase
MPNIGELFQSGDWKNEKHVPVIECPERVKAEESFEVRLSIGKEISHPNTTEHHIRWMQLFFKPTGDKFAYQVGNFEFTAHGEAVAGANQGPVYTDHAVTANLMLKQSGTLVAASYCNIHGFWESTREITVE